MIYILFGNSEYTIKKRIEKIIKTDFSNDTDIVKIDMEENTIGSLIDEYDQLTLTGETKLIVAYNSFFIENSKSKTKITKSDEYKELFECLKSQNNPNSLILVSYKDKIDTKNEIVKLTNNIGKIYEFKEPTKNDWSKFAFDYFKHRQVKISQDAIDELAKRTKYDLYSFNSEASKLLLYKGTNITIDDVKTLVSNNLEEDVFGVLNNLIIGNKEEAIKTYRDLRIQGVEPITLINLMSSSITFLLNVRNLSMMKYSIDEIASKTGSSTGRIFMTFKNLKIVSENTLYNSLEKLHKLDKEIKHSKVDRFLSFELFLINF